MICFDTNIIIYLGKGILREDIIGDEPICYASITRIESLGYTKILSSEQQRISELLATLSSVPLTDSVIDQAAKLRQFKKMTLGDSIIAATALEAGKVLWTANVEDFAHIDGLTLVNPLANTN